MTLQITLSPYLGDYETMVPSFNWTITNDADGSIVTLPFVKYGGGGREKGGWQKGKSYKNIALSAS